MNDNVESLKDASHAGIDAAPKIVNNEVTTRLTSSRNTATFRTSRLYSQINQVIMNIIVNGARTIIGPRARIFTTKPIGAEAQP